MKTVSDILRPYVGITENKFAITIYRPLCLAELVARVVDHRLFYEQSWWKSHEFAYDPVAAGEYSLFFKIVPVDEDTIPRYPAVVFAAGYALNTALGHFWKKDTYFLTSDVDDRGDSVFVGHSDENELFQIHRRLDPTLYTLSDS